MLAWSSKIKWEYILKFPLSCSLLLVELHSYSICPPSHISCLSKDITGPSPQQAVSMPAPSARKTSSCTSLALGAAPVCPSAHLFLYQPGSGMLVAGWRYSLPQLVVTAGSLCLCSSCMEVIASSRAAQMRHLAFCSVVGICWLNTVDIVWCQGWMAANSFRSVTGFFSPAQSRWLVFISYPACVEYNPVQSSLCGTSVVAHQPLPPHK